MQTQNLAVMDRLLLCYGVIFIFNKNLDSLIIIIIVLIYIFLSCHRS